MNNIDTLAIDFDQLDTDSTERPPNEFRCPWCGARLRMVAVREEDDEV